MQGIPESQHAPLIRTTPADTDSLTATIVTTVAQVNGRKPATPLYEVIDPDALEDLYHHSPLQVSFEYCGYQVTIHPDQTVTVTEF